MGSTAGTAVSSEAHASEALDDAALLGLIEHHLSILTARPLSGVGDGAALTDRLERLHRIATISAAEELRCIAEIDACQLWRAEGARSTEDLVAQRLALTRGEAKAQTETAVALESLAQTAAALRTGQMGLGQAQVAARPAAEVCPDVREELDRLVAADGARLDRRQLREHVDTWVQTVDPEVWRGGSGGRGTGGGSRSLLTPLMGWCGESFGWTRWVGRR